MRSRFTDERLIQSTALIRWQIMATLLILFSERFILGLNIMEAAIGCLIALIITQLQLWLIFGNYKATNTEDIVRKTYLSEVVKTFTAAMLFAATFWLLDIKSPLTILSAFTIVYIVPVMIYDGRKEING